MIKQKRCINKKAIFFSLDALIALIIILLSITVIYPIMKYSEKESRVPEDILSSLSALRIGDINSEYVENLRQTNKITDLNKSVLEQIGEFYVSTDPATKLLANELAEDILSTIDENENIGIWYNGKLLASRNKTDYDNAKDVNVERQIISGIQEGNATTGYSARAFLTNSEQTKYYYFGGYVGEGNITLNIEYSGLLINASLEIAASKDFYIYLNDERLEGFFEHLPSELEPKNFPLYAYRTKFNQGEVNTFKLVSADGSNNLHVAGGYLKLTYEDGVQYEQAERYYFPGIEGFVNLYDGFYVPGKLTSLIVNINAQVNDPDKKMYMKFGDIVIFNETTNGEEVNIFRDDDTIRTKIEEAGKNYYDFSNKTIPIRIGIVGVDYIQTEISADIISATSIGGNLGPKINIPSLGLSGMNALKYVNKKISNDFLNVPEMDSIFVGIAISMKEEGGDDYYIYNYHNLTKNEQSLINEINTWGYKGSNQDYCMALKNASEELVARGNEKFIILLAHDVPNNCESDNEVYLGNENPTSWADVKYYVCDSGNFDPSIRVYTVMAAADNIESEVIPYVNAISACTGGETFESEDYDEGLLGAYDGVIEEILSLIFDMQSIDTIRSANAGSYLSPDSYIEFSYERTEAPYGIIISSEKMFDTESGGFFNIPADSEIVETKIISYSGSKWTKDIKLNGELVYNLDDYGLVYTGLGDPYAINIPNSAIHPTNNILLTTAITPTNASPGSSFNKIIYTIVKNMVSYSQIVSNAKGCIWEVEFEDGSSLTIRIPDNEETTDTCFYHNVGGISTITCKNAQGVQVDCEDSDDALKIAIYNLFKKLDSDEDGRLDIKFEEQNLEITSSEITGIPYPWETEVQVRKWW